MPLAHWPRCGLLFLFAQMVLDEAQLCIIVANHDVDRPRHNITVDTAHKILVLHLQNDLCLLLDVCCEEQLRGGYWNGENALCVL